MNTDYWAMLSDSEREQWGYVPRQMVGPLSFGIHRHEAITIMAEHGFSNTESEIERWSSQRAQWRVEFCRVGPEERRPAVKCYFVEGVGLTCVLVDGLRGPQVTCEGIRLIGRVPSELDAEMEAYALEQGLGIWYCLTGDLGWPDYAFDRGAQRAGDTVVSWASFCKTGDIAGTSWDVTPSEVWHHG
ncbi:hypothetical protein [Streptomyces poonensis]|uniref:Uncharacterized protein n=1 Tax=Streptomyces poonensis TaxID=68255 RepID=A0A918UBS6_9ACTN|nr:hypothetical protein [Streptomyces poonensis]GGY88566.1 hypothetical protein GCM10010365_03280 [Streptomyces poonensis]GLJ92386.1 hypothetical protein GCM10017589_49950 [Streptomyces poonensis]